MPDKYDFTAFIIIILVAIILSCLWFYNPGFRVIYYGDSFLDANQFIPGSNFKELGFWNLRFTADYAVGPAGYHPFYYTHNGPLSEIINGIYQKLGVRTIEWQRLISIVWTSLGLAFFYLALRILTGKAVALWCLAVASTNPFVLSWGDNLFSSYQWALVYLAFFSFSLNIRKNSIFSFATAWMCFFLAAFSNYELVPQIAIFALGLKVLGLEAISARKIMVFFSAPLAAFCLRNSLVVWAVGYNVWYRDLTEILLHRAFGIKTSIMEMYKHIPVIMWDTEAMIPKDFLPSLYLKLENLYGYGWSLFLAALIIPRLRSLILPKKDALRAYRLIWLFFIMGVFWFFAFPQHTSAHFHGSTMLLFSPFSSLLWGYVLIGLWQNMPRISLKLICSAAIICSLTASRMINFIPPRQFPGIDALGRYKGKVFCTNAIPALVEYYTGAPAAFCGYEEQIRDLFTGRYYFFLRADRFSLPIPEFFLSISIFGWDKDRFSDYFSVVESGEGYTVYRLQLKEGQQ
jgi:hypothetical protein